MLLSELPFQFLGKVGYVVQCRMDQTLLFIFLRRITDLEAEISIMNREELINAMAAKTGSDRVDAQRAVAALIEIISGTLKKGDSLSLVGFGSFEVRQRAARAGRNPKTGEALKIKASRVPSGNN